jgi:hypothetical protein
MWGASMTRADVQFGRDLRGWGTIDYAANLIVLRQGGYSRRLLMWLLPLGLLGAASLALMAFLLIGFLVFVLVSGGGLGVLLCLLYQHFWLRREAQVAIGSMDFTLTDRMGGTVILRSSHISVRRWLWFDVRRVEDLAVSFPDSRQADEFIAAFEDQRKRHLLSPALARPAVGRFPPLPEPDSPPEPGRR